VKRQRPDPAFWVRNMAYSRHPACFIIDGASWFAFVVGVGNNPHSGSLVWKAKVASPYAAPPSIIPDVGQVPENSVKPSSQERSGVFHENEARSYLANKTEVLGPKAAALAINADLSTCARDVLAREPSADDVNGNSIGSKAFCGKGSDVIVAGNLGPVLRQDAAAEGFDLAEGDRLESARALQAEREAADTGKKVEDLVHQAARAGLLTPPVPSLLKLLMRPSP